MTKISFKRITKLRESGRFCCVEIKSDHDYCWDIGLYINGSKHKAWDVCAGDEDINKAIFQCYKKALKIIGTPPRTTKQDGK